METLQPVISDYADVTDTQALTQDQAGQLFEKMAQRYLKMSTPELLARLESGFFREHPELERRLDSVLFYLPLIRQQ